MFQMSAGGKGMLHAWQIPNYNEASCWAGGLESRGGSQRCCERQEQENPVDFDLSPKVRFDSNYRFD